MTLEFRLDGRPVSLHCPFNMPLIGALNSIEADRHPLSTGDVYCDPDPHARSCGLCIVLLNGLPVRACMVPAFRVHRAAVDTVRRVQQSADYETLKQQFNRAHVCTGCYAARLLLVWSLMQRDAQPLRTTIADYATAVRCGCVTNAAFERIIVGIVSGQQRRRHVWSTR